MPGVQVIAHALDAGSADRTVANSTADLNGARLSGAAADRTVTSSSDGSYIIDDLKPGRYQLVASKDGFANSPESTLEVAAGQSAAADLTLGELPKAGFMRRFIRAYKDDWKPSSGSSGPAPKFRGYPAPVTNPPFPFTVWPYGGSVTIGQPWTQAPPDDRHLGRLEWRLVEEERHSGLRLAQCRR
jgi:hypothetical protein